MLWIKHKQPFFLVYLTVFFDRIKHFCWICRAGLQMHGFTESCILRPTDYQMLQIAEKLNSIPRLRSMIGLGLGQAIEARHRFYGEKWSRYVIFSQKNINTCCDATHYLSRPFPSNFHPFHSLYLPTFTPVQYSSPTITNQLAVYTLTRIIHYTFGTHQARTSFFSQSAKCQPANPLPASSGTMLLRSTFWSSLCFKASLLSTGTWSPKSSVTESLRVPSCK